MVKSARQIVSKSRRELDCFAVGNQFSIRL
jgi:hypothetical protein